MNFFLYLYTGVFFLRRFIWSKNSYDHPALLINHEILKPKGVLSVETNIYRFQIFSVMHACFQDLINSDHQRLTHVSLSAAQYMAEGMKTEGTLWFSNLLTPDQLYILPVILLSTNLTIAAVSLKHTVDS